MYRMHSYLNLDATTLDNNITDFLLAVDEKLPAWAKDGFCNGHAFMSFRADQQGQLEKHMKRLRDLSLAGKNQISKGLLYA